MVSPLLGCLVPAGLGLDLRTLIMRWKWLEACTLKAFLLPGGLVSNIKRKENSPAQGEPYLSMPRLLPVTALILFWVSAAAAGDAVAASSTWVALLRKSLKAAEVMRRLMTKSTSSFIPEKQAGAFPLRKN